MGGLGLTYIVPKSILIIVVMFNYNVNNRMLVFLLSSKEAKYLVAGNSLSFNNHFLQEIVKRIQGNDLGYGNIVEDFSQWLKMDNPQTYCLS